MTQFRYQPKTAADIVQRLPLHRSMNASQAALLALTPRWQLWLKQAVAEGKISSTCAETSQLIAWQARAGQSRAGKLLIQSNNSANATLLKQHRNSIIEFLNSAADSKRSRSERAQTKATQTTLGSAPKEQNILTVEQLVIRLKFDDQQLSLPSQSATSDEDSGPKPLNQQHVEQISNAIEVCKNQTENEKLAKSLENLASTLSAYKR